MTFGAAPRSWWNRVIGDPQVQREALMALFTRLHEQGVATHDIFRGFWVCLFGALVYRSRFLPRFLGVLLPLSGVAWVVSGVSFFMLPTPSAQRIANVSSPC
jgi:Domain of unknown function (DUF4386)